MSDRVLLVGLDFGTTTSCAVVASAAVVNNSITGRMELSRIEHEFQSEHVFTPLVDDRLDEGRLGEYLDEWLARIDRQRIFGGGALITGLAAQRANAAAFARQTRRYLQDAIIAAGEDPCLESWLAFMGNCADLSRGHADRTFVNLDIGGGTTNVAAGRNGEVFRTGSYFVGARHVQVVPGSYQITRLSAYARHLLDHLGIAGQVGDVLTESQVQAIVGWYLRLLEEVVTGTADARTDSAASRHVQVPFEASPASAGSAITLSGGVGQLVYSYLQGGGWPAVTAFGDLGIDLARALVESAFWRRRHLQAFVPTKLGRATVYGLLRYNTQVSGNTLFLSNPKVLPLSDLVVLGSIGPNTPPVDIQRLLALAGRTPHGACLKIELPGHDLDALRGLAGTMREALAKVALARRPSASQRPLVLLLRENLGKVFGQYLTNWNLTNWKTTAGDTASAPIVVIDEVDPRDVQFAHVGRLREGVLPVSFYGMSPTGELS